MSEKLVVPERVYITLTNQLNVSAALRHLRNVFPGRDWGVTREELVAITSPLYKIEDRLRDSVGTQDE